MLFAVIGGLHVVRPPPCSVSGSSMALTTPAAGSGGARRKPSVSRSLRPHIIRRVYSPNDDSQEAVMWFAGLFILWKPTKSSIGW